MWINWEIWLVKSHVTTSLYSRVVYILEWRHPYSSVSCTEYPPNSGHVFLPEWYVKKLPPPTDWGSSFVFYMTFELFKLCWVLIFLHTHFITVTENLSLLFCFLCMPSITPFLSTVFSALMVYCTISSLNLIVVSFQATWASLSTSHWTLGTLEFHPWPYVSLVSLKSWQQ